MEKARIREEIKKIKSQKGDEIMPKVLTKEQLEFLLEKGYLSSKGKKVAKDVLTGKYDESREKAKRLMK